MKLKISEHEYDIIHLRKYQSKLQFWNTSNQQICQDPRNHATSIEFDGSEKNVRFLSRINLNLRLSKTWVRHLSQKRTDRRWFYHSCSFNKKRWYSNLGNRFVIMCKIAYRCLCFLKFK